MKKYIITFFIFSSFLTFAQQLSIRGRVTDAAKINGLSGIELELFPIGKSTITDVNGYFSFDSLSSGIYVIKIFFETYSDYTDTLELKTGQKDNVMNIEIERFGFPRINYRDTTISGDYMRGFESNSIHPCNSNEYWWIIYATKEFQEKYNSIRQNPLDKKNTYGYGLPKVFLTIKCKISELGRFGHLGGSQRVVKIEKVIEMRLFEEHDCDEKQ